MPKGHPKQIPAGKNMSVKTSQECLDAFLQDKNYVFVTKPDNCRSTYPKDSGEVYGRIFNVGFEVQSTMELDAGEVLAFGEKRIAYCMIDVGPVGLTGIQYYDNFEQLYAKGRVPWAISGREVKYVVRKIIAEHAARVAKLEAEIAELRLSPYPGADYLAAKEHFDTTIKHFDAANEQ